MGDNPDDIVRAQLMRERARPVPTTPMSARPGMGQPASEQGIYRAEMGPPPMEPDAGVLELLKRSRPPMPRPPVKPPRKPEKKETTNLAKGGSIDGCAQRGKTRGKIIK